MRADDDGFVKNPKGIMSLIGVKRTAYTELVTKKWLIEFNNGVVVVTHWKLNNYIQKDNNLYTELSTSVDNYIIKQELSTGPSYNITLKQAYSRSYPQFLGLNLFVGFLNGFLDTQG